MPSGGLCHRRADHPFAEGRLQMAAMEMRQEVGWSEQAQLGMLPTDQCLNANDPAIVLVHLGLVEQHKFLVQQRLMHGFQVFAMGLRLAIAFRIE